MRRTPRTPKKAVTHEERKMQQMSKAKSMERSEADPVISTQRTTAPSMGRATMKRPGDMWVTRVSVWIGEHNVFFYGMWIFICSIIYVGEEGV